MRQCQQGTTVSMGLDGIDTGVVLTYCVSDFLQLVNRHERFEPRVTTIHDSVVAVLVQRCFGDDLDGCMYDVGGHSPLFHVRAT